MNLRDLKLRLRALVSFRRADHELDEELSFHIERETQKLIDQGMEPDAARWQARARFGSTTVIADECRDERGTAFVDNTIRDIQYALRMFVRAPLAALTIVVTVGIGLGVVAVLFTILNTFVFRLDAVPDIAEMYAVQGPEIGDGVRARLTRAQFDALRSETSVFSDVYAALPDIDLHVDGRVMAVVLVTANFFDVVRVKPVMGRALTADDDRPGGGNPVIVLSDKGWTRRFHRDPNVVGRTVLVSGTPFEIIGVMPAGFRGLEVSGPDFWAPLSQLAPFRPGRRGNEAEIGVDVIGRLKPGVSLGSARAQLAAWESNQSVAAPDRRRITVDLAPRRGTVPQPMEAIALFTPLFIVFGLILMIGCANVANLLLARGVARQREIGVRLSIGASRRRIVRQLMTESLLLAVAAAGVGYILSRIALAGTIYSVLRVMPLDLGDINLNVPAADWRVALFLVFAAFGATAFFALIPALQATRIDPVRTLRGDLVKTGRPSRARNALIAVQVFASTLLLISAAIFLRSAFASSQYDPGFRTADTVMIDVTDATRAAILQGIASDPAITAYAATRPSMLDQRAGLADAGGGKQRVPYKFVSGAYFGVMGIPIVRGRTFTDTERDDAAVVVVSESTARLLWPDGNDVGRTFVLEPDPNVPQSKDETPLPSRTVTVVGVSRDIKGFRFNDGKQAAVFVPTSVDAPHTAVMARITGDADLARQTILEHLTRIDSNMGMIVTMRTVARLDRFFLGVAFWIAFVLGSLALLLTVSGLFSVLSYLIEQRTKEIGVRIALGASSQHVTRLMLSQTTRPVAYGLLGGGGLAAALAGVLLATDLGAFVGPIVHVTDPIAYIISLSIIIVACAAAAWIPASRASRLDPMRTLRQE